MIELKRKSMTLFDKMSVSVETQNINAIWYNVSVVW